MKATVQVSRGIESLFGTRDENIRLLETGLNVSTRLGEDTLEIEGEPESVARAEAHSAGLFRTGARRRRFQERRSEQPAARRHRRSRGDASRASSTAASSAVSARKFWRRKPSRSAATSKPSSATISSSASVLPAPAKTYLAVAMAIQALIAQARQPHHSHPARRGSGRAARLPARQPAGKDRSLSAPALRRALRHARIGQGGEAAGARLHRSGAARLHARPHAQRQLHHSRRSAEHHLPNR